MPRYYFDIQEGPKSAPDHDGEEFDGLEAAESGALRTLAELGRDRLLKGNAGDLSVEVKNEQHQRVLTVAVAMRIERVKPTQDLTRQRHPAM